VRLALQHDLGDIDLLDAISSRDLPVPSFGPHLVCTAFGIIGADARPNWKEQRERPTGVQWKMIGNR
jgi:hypothetical protein